MALVFPISGMRLTDLNGNPASGAKIRFFDAGTTNPKTVYSDSGLTTPHAVPIVADSAGIVPAIYVTAGDFKIQVTTSADIAIFTIDFWTIVDNTVSTSPISFLQTTKTADYTVVSGDRAKVINVDTTGGNRSVFLTSAGTVGNGFPVFIRKGAAANTLTVDPAGAETINGNATYPMNANGQLVFICSDGANWTILGVLEAGAFATTVTFNKDIVTPYVTLTDAATVALDASSGSNFKLTATGGVGATRAIGSPTNLTAGQMFEVTFVQDATGGRALTWNAIFVFPGNIAPRASQGANEESVYKCRVITGSKILAELKYHAGGGPINFWKEYDMGAYSQSTTFSQAHGLGRYPSSFQAWLENTTTEDNYAVGDRVHPGYFMDEAGNSEQVMAWMNTTEVGLTSGANAPNYPNKTTQAAASLTASNWKLIFRVFE